MTNEEKRAKVEPALFLSLLLGLCREYGVTISGCGCCDGPWLDIDEGRFERLHVGVKHAEMHTDYHSLNNNVVVKVTT